MIFTTGGVGRAPLFMEKFIRVLNFYVRTLSLYLTKGKTKFPFYVIKCPYLFIYIIIKINEGLK